jgi:hypothetical protein
MSDMATTNVADLSGVPSSTFCLPGLPTPLSRRSGQPLFE